MSNALALAPAYHPQLPAFLQDPALFAATDAAIAGIGGGVPPYVSIKASKWRLVGADGEESLVNQLHLDVIVLAGNEHVSKQYYEGAYDPAAGNMVAPACWSDNGVAPSSLAQKPQHQNCAACQHNAWGSKVTPTGSQVKACSDSKKLAVVLASDTPVIVNGAAGVAKALDQVYLLRVPAASMRGWRDYAKDIRGRGIPIIGVVTQMSFDPNASYPALLFKPAAFVTEEVYKRTRAALEQPAVAEAIGSNDRPLASSPLPAQIPAHLSAPAIAAAAAPEPTPPATSPPPALTVASSAAPATDTAGTRRRGRPAAVAAASSPSPAMASSAVPAAGAPLFPQGVPVSGAVIQPAQPASDDLDALLARVTG